MIQIRNVPEDLHRRLKMRATKCGKTLSDLLKEMAEREVARPDIQEFLARVRRIPPDASGFDATAFIRRQRGMRRSCSRWNCYPLCEGEIPPLIRPSG